MIDPNPHIVAPCVYQFTAPPPGRVDRLTHATNTVPAPFCFSSIPAFAPFASPEKELGWTPPSNLAS